MYLWLTLTSVCALHEAIVAETGGKEGILSKEALDSTLNKPLHLFFYHGKEATVFDLAALYGYGLIKNHCFVDGNKRIAFVSMYVFLEKNGFVLEASEVEVVAVMLAVAASQEKQDVCVEKLAGWLRKNCIVSLTGS